MFDGQNPSTLVVQIPHTMKSQSQGSQKNRKNFSIYFRCHYLEITNKNSTIFINRVVQDLMEGNVKASFNFLFSSSHWKWQV